MDTQISISNLFRHAQRLDSCGVLERFLVPSRSCEGIIYRVEFDSQTRGGHCTCRAGEFGKRCAHLEAALHAFDREHERDTLQNEIAALEAVLRRFERVQDCDTMRGRLTPALVCDMAPDEAALRRRLEEAKARHVELSHRVARLSQPAPHRWRLWMEGEALAREAYWHSGRPANGRTPNWHLPGGRGEGDALTLEIALLHSVLLDVTLDAEGQSCEISDAARLALRMRARWEARVGVELYLED